MILTLVIADSKLVPSPNIIDVDAMSEDRAEPAPVDMPPAPMDNPIPAPVDNPVVSNATYQVQAEAPVRQVPAVEAPVSTTPAPVNATPVTVDPEPVRDIPATISPAPVNNASVPTTGDGTLPSDMPPPPIPSSSQIPQVNLLPPTPNTSQEAANSGPTTLLHVPDPSQVTSNPPARSRSRSRSPAPSQSEVRRSPRLASPGPPSNTPGTKRPAPEPLEEPVAKKLRE